ncbi:uncharacterized protein GGS22DRAFT_149234 [Annulohypoxylon maeteangense]|uniref:uncharacterized protein n=1 Tax=Annulohypoxylon maeteangense TaxID=1927788 RepID=UPI002007FF5C|nr:uncharacterized protein GGS22DRAFT_149234 [Annulohypoxylon maeteangense]KAI0889828.1 hypothetical protein GGS22DRAFT_149234 [Annulohypoxylon maeteangense]
MDSATSEATPEPQIVPQVVFRGKKRKTYRQRPEPISDATTINNINEDATNPAETPRSATASEKQAETTTATEEEGENGLLVSEVLRLRNARKARLGGVKFGGHPDARATSGGGADDMLDDLSLMIREEEGKAMDVAAGVQKRFAPQTGLSAEIVNKHMEEYIESELARRHHAVASSSSSVPTLRGSTLTAPSASSQQVKETNDNTTTSTTTTTTTTPRPEHPHRALQGQLMEIDLGDEARSRNEALTERATRRFLHGETAAADDEDGDASSGAGGRPRKVRLGRDGKPWRPRNRRTSDDVRRDQLVEEILRENRLDVYETPTPPATATPGAEGAEAADDRIAEEFRREFMDAQAERQQKRKKPANAPPGGGAAGAGGGKGQKDEDVLKGPKLGGSRNVRAAMRNLLLEKAKEAKRPGR